MDGPCAIGRIEPGGPWVGFVRGRERYELAAGAEGGPYRSMPADEGLLLAIAIAYFEDVLDDPPPALEATHADLSTLVRDVAGRAPDPERRRLLAEAVDSIDDGLAVDEVIGRLVAAWSRTRGAQTDPVDLLRERVEELLRRP
jgi:hypothetical protein